MPNNFIVPRKSIIYATILLLYLVIGCDQHSDIKDLKTPFEVSNGLETCTYEEGIDWWRELEHSSPHAKLIEFGATDAGKPLHLVILNAKRKFSLENLREESNLIVLINNGIHPGEPDGIDASMIWARDLLSNSGFETKYDNVVFAIIPFYNVGGAIDRNCCSRANQNGPQSYGFRGNSRNLDLNRDFVKCDSKNARSFNQLFTSIDPDIYLETHVSNGADYPYTMTYLVSQPDKLGSELGTFVRKTLSPSLYSSMAQKGDEMVPYVNVHGKSPEDGYAAFYDSPRYSTGYAALHHSIGMLTETHMLKPFKDRVESTTRFLHSLSEVARELKTEIISNREAELKRTTSDPTLPIHWELDSTNVQAMQFSGYQAYMDTSIVTGKSQMYFNRESVWSGKIPYYGHMKAKDQIEVPTAYLVPASWNEVVDRLSWNQVKMELIDRDTTLEIVAYEIMDTKTPNNPYEGHYVHSNTQVEKQYWATRLTKESYYMIKTDQNKRRFIVEMLEPTARDSYFNWNFFDEILMQKEWFSAYIFDKEAEELLETDTTLARSFNQMKSQDSVFANDAFSQLYFLYRNSSHYERDKHNIYPVYRIE